MKTIYITLAIIAGLSALPSCTPQNNEPRTYQEATGYRLFNPSFIKGNAYHTGYISTRKQRLDWLIEHRAANRKLAKFIVSADLNTQKTYLYEYTHTGSSQDRPAYKVTQNGNTLTLVIFDANTSPVRTRDIRTSTHFAAIHIDRNKIKTIKVVNHMNSSTIR